MCTAVSYRTRDHYFGRNLDLEYSYRESVTITPRQHPLSFRHAKPIKQHYAMIGMAYVCDDYPLYYDATNEKGLSMAGLNFPGNADYKPFAEGCDNIAPFEFIPWILGQCATVAEAKALLDRISLLEENFSDELPLSPLHWIIADRECAITVESVKDGLKIYDNPIGILTNNPPFDYQITNLSNYMHLSVDAPRNSFAPTLQLDPYSRGMGGLGLPGDQSSVSRFVRAAFIKMNSRSEKSEHSSVNQFFHILDSVAQPRGCVHLEEDQYEITLYSSCCNTDRCIYYYTTYENREITGVDLLREDLDSSELINYSLLHNRAIYIQN